MQRRPHIAVPILQRSENYQHNRSVSENPIVPPEQPRPVIRTAFAPDLETYVKTCSIKDPYMTPKRIQLDLEELERHPIKGVNLGPINDNLYEWMIVVDGPSTTVYEGGLFFVEITIPTDYPFNPPSIKFRTRIYHPNIDSQGRVCVDLISGNWTPQKTMHTVIEGIVSLLHHCQPEDALVPAIGEMYMNNIQEFERIARMWTKRYSLVTSTPDSESEENVQLNGKDFEGTKSNGFGLSEMM